MKEYFDRAITILEQMPINSDRNFYCLGYIHGLESCGFVSDDESRELLRILDYKKNEVRRNANTAR